jgi:uncharacterized protein (TIGR01244 family)
VVKPINEDFSAAGQVTPEELEQIAKDGFQSVLNLRSPDEQGFVKDEPQIAESLGLNYANAPFNPASADEKKIAEILAKLDQLPKPTLIHCAGGLRASAIAIFSIAKQQELTALQALEKARSAGFDYSANPKLQQLIEQWFSAKVGS